jgi:uncharacterized membrane protein
MLREHLEGAVPGEKGFRWRAEEITRLESFSDTVFALAVTLLIVSLEVPRDFHELTVVMRGFTGFGICFALLANLWFYHVLFFRRYGLQTPLATFLNAVFLFCILFYVYPVEVSLWCGVWWWGSH